MNSGVRAGFSEALVCRCAPGTLVLFGLRSSYCVVYGLLSQCSCC